MNCKYCNEKLIVGENISQATEKICVVCDEARADMDCYDESYFEEGR